MNKNNCQSKNWLVNEYHRSVLLYKSIPAFVVIVFILGVIGMNLLAQFTIVSLPFLAINAGIFVSWISFLTLDIVTRHFGSKAANKLSILAMIINALTYLVLFILSHIFNKPNLDMILGGQWSILLASSIAFLISALTNNYTNVAIGKKLSIDPNGKKAYALRSFISTFISQIFDNFFFLFLAFYIFPLIPFALQVKWSIFQIIGCSILGALFELISEIIVSPIGFNILKRWREKEVGKEYLDKYCPNGVLNEK